MLTVNEVLDALEARENAMAQNMKVDDRIKADLYDIDGDVGELVDDMLSISLKLSKGSPIQALKLSLMGGIELGRELERRAK